MLLPNDKVSFTDFRNVLSVVYPSFIGIFQGANLCSDLKRPFKAIPRGTFLSVLASTVLYSSVFFIAALAAPSSVLREDTELLLRYAWPSPLLGYAGTMAVGLISALSCFGAALLLSLLLSAAHAVAAIVCVSHVCANCAGVWGRLADKAGRFASSLRLQPTHTHTRTHTHTPHIKTQRSPPASCSPWPRTGRSGS
jgi:amino acid transporter